MRVHHRPAGRTIGSAAGIGERMPVARPLSVYPTYIQPVSPNQWVERFARLLVHWRPDLSPEDARRTAEDWHRSLGALGPVQAFTMFRRVASDAESRSQRARALVPRALGSPRNDLLARIAAATSHSEIEQLLVALTAASGGGPIPVELAAAVEASQLRMKAADQEAVRRARLLMEAPDATSKP